MDLSPEMELWNVTMSNAVLKMITCYFELGSDTLVEPQIGKRLRA